MKKLLNNPWFVSILTVAAIVLVTSSILDQTKSGSVRPTVVADEEENWDEPIENDFESDESGTIAEALASLVIPESINDPIARIDERGGPSVSIVETARGPDDVESIRLTAIWEQGATLLLVVNNHIHEVGDQIGRLTIESANLDGAWLTHWKGRDFLPFGGEFTLVTPAPSTANSTPASDES